MTQAGRIGAYLEITLFIPDANRSRAVSEVYQPYRQPFLNEASGALLKELLVRAEDVQVLHGFDTVANAQAYLQSEMFSKVAGLLSQLWDKDPVVTIYAVA